MMQSLILVLLFLLFRMLLAFDECSVDNFEEAKRRARCAATCEEASQFRHCVEMNNSSSNCTEQADFPMPLNYSIGIENTETKLTLKIDGLNDTFNDNAVTVLCPDKFDDTLFNKSYVILIVGVEFMELDTSYWTIVGSKQVPLTFIPFCYKCVIKSISVAIAGNDVSEDDFQNFEIQNNDSNGMELDSQQKFRVNNTGYLIYNESTFCFPEVNLEWNLSGSYKTFYSLALEHFDIECKCGECGQGLCGMPLRSKMIERKGQTNFHYRGWVEIEPQESSYECKLTAIFSEDFSCVSKCLGLSSWVKGFSLDASGRPPEGVSNITIVQDGFCFNISWLGPSTTNGKITHYEVTVIEWMPTSAINSTGHNNFNTTTTSLLYCCVYCKAFDGILLVVSVVGSNKYGSSKNKREVVYSVIYPSRQQDAKAEKLGYIAIVFLVLMVIVATLVISIALKRKLGRKKKGNILLLQTSASHRFFQKSPPSPVDRWTISVNSFDPDSFNLIGEGAFSSVYFCTVQGPLSTPTNLHHFKNCVEHPVAVKICKETASENELIAFKNECTIYKHLSANCCPYILQLVGLQLQSPPPMIALELVYCGSLLDLLQNSTVEIKEGSSTKCLKDQKRKISLIEFQRQCEGKVDSFVSLKERSKQELQGTNDLTISIKWSQLMKFIVQIARGMEFLISQGVLHRDVACRNFLLSNGIVKISDFGFACLLNDQECVETDLPTECKPLRWMSPEAFNMNLFSEASEVWSFGVSLWEICTKGCFPYSSLSDAEVLKAIQSEDYLKCPEGCDDKVYQIMLQCWTKDRTSRPTFTMLTRKLEECMCELYPYVVMTDDKQ